jgi:hypothetical protein
MRKRWYFVGPAAIVGIVLFTFLGGELVMRLWNWLLPGLFGWRMITFWQAIGILALSRILFGRIGGRGFRGSGFRGSGFRGRMGQRWERMTPEEREKFREGLRGWCGVGTAGGESKEPAGGL